LAKNPFALSLAKGDRGGHGGFDKLSPNGGGVRAGACDPVLIPRSPWACRRACCGGLPPSTKLRPDGGEMRA